MAMNEVNPLRFIRRVIPDTAADTNAETFKQKAALGLQENKQAAAMRDNLARIASANRSANLGADFGPDATDAEITLGQDQKRAIEQALKSGQAIDAFRSGGVGLEKPDTVFKPSDVPNLPFKGGLALKGEAQEFAKAAATREIEAAKKRKVEKVETPGGIQIGATQRVTEEESSKNKTIAKNTPESKALVQSEMQDQITAFATKKFGRPPEQVMLDGKGGFMVKHGGKWYPGQF